MWFLSSKTGACSRFEASLADLLEAGPGAKPDASLAAHLAVCVDCREAFDSAREAGALVRANAVRVPPSLADDPYFASRVAARIRENAGRSGEFWPTLETASLRMMAYALSLAILLGALSASGVTRGARPAVARVPAAGARTVSLEANPTPVNPDEVVVALLSGDQGRQR